tara:strand:+ start:527 stop:835 length:309 start_codon:yes stop_codon:yes gene_type:complete
MNKLIPLAAIGAAAYTLKTTGGRAKRLPGGYVMDSLYDAEGRLGLAEGGLHYRMYDKEGASGQTDTRAVAQAHVAVKEAREKTRAALRLLSGVELNYTGRER